MSNKGTETALKQEINLNIIPNNQQQLITGAKLNVVLLDMVDTLMYLLGNGSGGAANYENLYNKPSINGYELNGEVSLSALGLISSADIALAYQKKITESNKLAADYISGLAKVAITGDYNDLINKPEISGGEISNVSWGEQTATSVTLIVEGVGKTLLTPQALDNYVQASTLFENGVIRSTLLPSYVDDVLEYTSRSNFPSTGQAGKIYVALDTNKTYRWGGSTYVVISETIAIGTTAGTAYDGAAGKALADAIAGIPNHYYNKTEIDDILLGYVDDAQIASYYNKNEVDNKLKGYVTNAAFADSIDDYLTITDAADIYYKKTGGIISGGVTINGATTINNSLSVNSLKIGGISISVNSDGILFVEGTLATSGGLSVRGVSTGSGGGGSASLPAVWESLSGHRDEYKNVQINKSHLTAYLTATEVATSYATRGSLAALDERVTEIESSSTSVSYTPSVTSGQLLGTIVIDGKGSAIYAPSIAGLASESWVTSNFLGLGGGTISGLLTIRRSPSVIRFASGVGDILGFLGFGVANEPAFYENDGATGHTIIHSGNIGSYNAGGANFLSKSYANEDANRPKGDGVKMIYTTVSGSNMPTYTSGISVITEYGGWQMISYAIPSELPNPYYRAMGSNGSYTMDWRQLAFLDDNVASADYATSAGNADTLGGIAYTGFARTYSDNFDNLLECAWSARFQTAWISGQGDFCSLVIPTWMGNSSDSWYLSEIRFPLGGSPKMRMSKNGSVTNDWREFAFTDSDITGSARRLRNPSGLDYANADGSEVLFGYITSQAAINTYLDGYNLYLRYGTGHTTGLTLNSSGNVLIGTTNDNGYKFDCVGNGRFQSGLAGVLSIKRVANAGAFIDYYPANQEANFWRVGATYDFGFAWEYNGSEKLSLSNAGNLTASGTIAGRSISVTSVNQSSDRRLKREESRSTPLTIEDVAQLNVRSYKWIDKSMGEELQIGLYAQDVQSILPEIVSTNESTKMLGLDYGVGGAVFGVLAAQSIVKQIKPALTEQQKRIVELEQRVEFLEKLTYGGK